MDIADIAPLFTAVAHLLKPGGRFVLDVQITNSGFGALYNPRPVFVVLEGGGARYQVELAGVDPRRWAPGETSSLSVHLELPASASVGTYTLSLWLPDAAKTLADRAEYAVRFANTAVWSDSDGQNALGSIELSMVAPGGANPGATELKVIP